MQWVTGTADHIWYSSKASGESLRVVHERLEAFRRASVLFHLFLESDLSCGPPQFSMGVVHIVNEAVGSHYTSVVELISSVS